MTNTPSAAKAGAKMLWLRTMKASDGWSGSYHAVYVPPTDSTFGDVAGHSAP